MKYVDYVTNGNGNRKGDIMEGTASAIFGMDGSEDNEDFMELPLDDIISKDTQVQPIQDQNTQITQQIPQPSQGFFNGIESSGYDIDTTKFGNVVSDNVSGGFGNDIGGLQMNTHLPFGTTPLQVPPDNTIKNDSYNDDSSNNASMNDGFDDDDIDKFFGGDNSIEQPVVENPIGFCNTFEGSKGGQFYKAASNFVLTHQSDKSSSSSSSSSPTSTMENTLMALLQRMMPSQSTQPPPQPSFPSIPQPLSSFTPIQPTQLTSQPIPSTHQPKPKPAQKSTQKQPNNQNYNPFPSTNNPQIQSSNPNSNQISQNHQTIEGNQPSSLKKEQDVLEQILKGVKTSAPSTITSSISPKGPMDQPFNTPQKGNEYSLNEQLQELGFTSQGGNSSSSSSSSSSLSRSSSLRSLSSSSGIEGGGGGGGEVAMIDLPKMPESTDVSFIDPAIVVVSTGENDHEKSDKKVNITKDEKIKGKGITQIKIERPSIQNQNLGGKERESDHKKEGSGIKIQRPGNSSQNNTLAKEEKKSGNGKRRNKKQVQNADEKETGDENGQKRKLRIIRKTNDAKPEVKREVKSEWKTLEATKPFSQILLEDSSKK